MRQGFKARFVPDFESLTAGTSRIRLLESYLLRISCMVAAACIVWPSVVCNYFRLGFSSIPAEKIRPGIQKLAQVIERMG